MFWHAERLLRMWSLLLKLKDSPEWPSVWKIGYRHRGHPQTLIDDNQVLCVFNMCSVSVGKQPCDSGKYLDSTRPDLPDASSSRCNRQPQERYISQQNLIPREGGDTIWSVTSRNDDQRLWNVGEPYAVYRKRNPSEIDVSWLADSECMSLYGSDRVRAPVD